MPKNMGGSVYSVCPLPSSPETFPSTSPTITPNNHTQGGSVLRLRGSADGGERKWRLGWKEGRRTLLTLLTFPVNKSLHNIGKIIWNVVVQSSLFFTPPPPPILSHLCSETQFCSSEHDMAILPGTAINNFSLLNLE